MTSTDAARLPTITTCGPGSFLIAATTTTTITTTTTLNAVTTCCSSGTIRSARTHVRTAQGRARSATRTEGSADENRTGVPQTGSDRRTLPGVGTYLIDTPKDSGLVLRQRLLSFQEQHRGLGKSQNDTLPEIPFRLNPKPEPPSPPASTMNQPPSILKADVGTSPMLDDGAGDPNFQPSRTDSPASSSTARTVTFATEPEVTAIRTQRVENGKPKPVPRNGIKRSNSREIDAKPLNKSANFTERTGKRNSSRSVRECTKVKLYSFNNEDIGKEPRSGHVTGTFPEFSRDTTRTHRMSYASKKKSSSLSDLTDVGVLFSLFDSDGDMATPRSLNSRSEKLGLYSFSQSKKSKSLLDLKSIQDCDLADLSAYHKRQRIAHLAFRRDNSIRTARHGTLSIEEADKEWLEMATTAVVDNTEYDKFASRRKPMISSNKKAAVGKSYNPKSGTNFKIAQPSSGKVFPVFFNDGLPVRKFGHTMYRKKITKSGKT